MRSMIPLKYKSSEHNLWFRLVEDPEVLRCPSYFREFHRISSFLLNQALSCCYILIPQTYEYSPYCFPFVVSSFFSSLNLTTLILFFRHLLFTPFAYCMSRPSQTSFSHSFNILHPSSYTHIHFRSLIFWRLLSSDPSQKP